MLRPSEEDILKIATPEDEGYRVSMEYAETILDSKIPEV